MLGDVDPLMLKQIYDPDGTDEEGSVRYVFSEQNNKDETDGILLGNEQAIDDSISIRDIHNCLMDNYSLTPIKYDTIDLTLQQKNTFNELFEYVRMLEDVNGKVNPTFITNQYVFNITINIWPTNDSEVLILQPWSKSLHFGWVWGSNLWVPSS